MKTQTNAALAGMLCSNPKYQAYLGVDSAEEAAVRLRKACGVESRRELDEYPAAAKRFHELRKAFAYGESV